MHTFYKLLCGVIVGLLFTVSSCKKNNLPGLAAGVVSIQMPSTKDTVEMSVSLNTDTTMIVGLKAILKGQTARRNHVISFAVDTSKMAFYRVKYGSNAQVLPYTSYYFFKSTCYIKEGNDLSDSIKLNIVQQTLLQPYSTYVLPIVIRSVDGQTNPITPGQTYYLVLKTGKATFISKADWKVIAVSSENAAGNSANVLNSSTSSWTTAFSAVFPHYITIDFGKPTTFSGVADVPASLSQACPTKVMIELSMDGTTWTDKGIFDPLAVNPQIYDTGISTARYLRFSVLAATPYLIPSFKVVNIREIYLVP